jgi:exodeoxyribonuclease-3
MSVYFPSGSSGEVRQSFKMEFLDQFLTYINTLKMTIPNLIISGDYNICHAAIDIHNPIRNKNTSGFLPTEREWVSAFLESGFVDSFRYINKDPHHYSWWSYRSNARAKNLGWRIDYNMISESLLPKLERALILPQAKHSDHCPVLVQLAD